MQTFRFLLPVTLVALAACTPRSPVTSGPSFASGARTSAQVPGNACDRKLLTLTDVDGILDTPVTGTKPLHGDPQTCYFITANDSQGGAELKVTLRPGLGKATLDSFTSGKMNTFATWKPLPGVGEQAIWMPDLHEVQARKGDLLCDIGVPMFMSRALRDAGEAAQQETLGGLCNKLFARY